MADDAQSAVELPQYPEEGFQYIHTDSDGDLTCQHGPDCHNKAVVIVEECLASTVRIICEEHYFESEEIYGVVDYV